MNARRFVLVDTTTTDLRVTHPKPEPISSRRPLLLQPIAWGKPDPKLARGCGTSLVAVTPKFRFKGLRCLLRAVTA